MTQKPKHLNVSSLDSTLHTQISAQGGVWEVVHTRDWPVAEFIARTFPSNPQSVRTQGLFKSHEASSKSIPTTFFKASPLLGKSARRYARKKTWLKQPLPRVREFHNLRWLRKHLFQAPRPVAAGVWVSGSGLSARPGQQWLCTEWLEEYTPWQPAWEAASPIEQETRLERIAAELARLHALGFVHRDCFPRNLLVHKERTQLPVTFLDAWAGGPGWSRRGPTYDLACFSLAWSNSWSLAQQNRFVDVYLDCRAQQDRPVRHSKSFLRQIARARAARWQRESRSAGIYGSPSFRVGTIFS